MSHPLDGAVAKFNRAKEQFDELRAELDSFFNREPKPHTSLGQFDEDTWEWIERFQVREVPPIRLGVILGDCVHNLRSALDHVVWQATILNGCDPDESTQFPIASKSEAQFDAIAKRRIPDLSTSHKTLVKRLQPYHAGDKAAAHPLSVLAELSNIDKHRIVNTTYSSLMVDTEAAIDELADAYQRADDSPFERFWIAAKGTRLEHGTPWLRIGLRSDIEAPRNMQVSGELTLGIAFGEIGLDAGDFPKIAEAIRSILDCFLADFPETEYIETG